MYLLAPAKSASEISSCRSEDDSITTQMFGHSFPIDRAASKPLPGIETSSSIRSTLPSRAISIASLAEPPSETTVICGSWHSTSRTHFRYCGWSSMSATLTTRANSKAKPHFRQRQAFANGVTVSDILNARNVLLGGARSRTLRDLSRRSRRRPWNALIIRLGTFGLVAVKGLASGQARVQFPQAFYGHFTTGGIDDRILSTLPPVFSPNVVPRS
jgi:hypothetical protein